VAGLGLDNYRFSVEWSRIEPAEGEISRGALEHYRRQCAGLRTAASIPSSRSTTSPPRGGWPRQGGWENTAAIERFGRFCGVVATELGDVMTRACTINEPNIVATMGWHAGMFPPGKTDKDLSYRVGANLVAGHRAAVEAIREAAPGCRSA
jgi:beta-glucosidase